MLVRLAFRRPTFLLVACLRNRRSLSDPQKKIKDAEKGVWLLIKNQRLITGVLFVQVVEDLMAVEEFVLAIETGQRIKKFLHFCTIKKDPRARGLPYERRLRAVPIFSKSPSSVFFTLHGLCENFFASSSTDFAKKKGLLVVHRLVA